MSRRKVKKVKKVKKFVEEEKKNEKILEIIRELEAEGRTLELLAVSSLLEVIENMTRKKPIWEEFLADFVKIFRSKLMELKEEDKLILKLEPVMEKLVGKLIEEIRGEAEKTRNEVISKVVEGINALDEGVWRVGQQNLIIQDKIDSVKGKFDELKNYLSDLNWNNQRMKW